MEQGKYHAVTVKRDKENGYLYQADFDGEWGELRLDRVMNIGEIITLSEWDTTKSHRFANRVICFLLQLEDTELNEEITLTFGG